MHYQITLICCLYLTAGLTWGYALFSIPTVNNYQFQITNVMPEPTQHITGPEKLMDPEINHKLVDKVREAKRNMKKFEQKGNA